MKSGKNFVVCNALPIFIKIRPILVVPIRDGFLKGITMRGLPPVDTFFVVKDGCDNSASGELVEDTIVADAVEDDTDDAIDASFDAAAPAVAPVDAPLFASEDAVDASLPTPD